MQGSNDIQYGQTLIPTSVNLERFEDLDDEVLLEILKWRNHPDIRLRMLGIDEIPAASHLAFVRALKNDSSSLYFRVSLNEQAIGVVDFYRIATDRSSCFYGYYLRPELLGSSLGVLLEFIAAEYALIKMDIARLVAETRPDNAPALRLHEKFGFVEKGLRPNGLIESDLTRERWRRVRGSLHGMIARLA